MPEEIDELDLILGGSSTTADGKKKVAATSNPLLMRLRLAALLVIGHKRYPDALSRITNEQASVFALFDAIKQKTDAVLNLPSENRYISGSRYLAVKSRYAGKDAKIPEVYRYYGLATFTARFMALSQSIMGDGRKEYLSGIEEKPVQLRYGSPDDLNIRKPSLFETLTGKPKPTQRERSE